MMLLLAQVAMVFPLRLQGRQLHTAAAAVVEQIAVLTLDLEQAQQVEQAAGARVVHQLVHQLTARAALPTQAVAVVAAVIGTLLAHLAKADRVVLVLL
jgi:hypothetical protein